MTIKKEKPIAIGRPTKYDGNPEWLKMVTNYCLLGCTDIELSNFLGVCEKTLNTWKHEHPDFLQSIKNGKEVADSNVAGSLYKRANGYEYKEDTFSIPYDSEGNPLSKDPQHTKTVKKEVVADVGAQVFWLRNRRGGRWSNKDRDEVNQIDVADFDFEEIDD